MLICHGDWSTVGSVKSKYKVGDQVSENKDSLLCAQLEVLHNDSPSHESNTSPVHLLAVPTSTNSKSFDFS